MRKPAVFWCGLALVWIGLGMFLLGQAPGGEIVRYEYYPDGLTKTLTYANGVVSHYEYYDNACLRSLESLTEAGELVSRYEYDYDANGNRTEMREWNATPARRAANPMWAAAPSVTKYGYDRLDRLVWAEYHPANGDAPYRRVEYTYDLVGNRLREVVREHAPDGTVLRTLKDRGFRYSRLNRLEAVTDALVPERGTRYLYDAAGNTVARITGAIGPDGEIVPDTEQSRLVFDWDAESRLRRVRQITPTPDGGTIEELLAEFRYDYRGRRIAADSRFVDLGGDPVPAETRLYVYDEEAVLAEYGFGPDGKTPYKSRQYLYGNELLAVELYAPPEDGKTNGGAAASAAGSQGTGHPNPSAAGGSPAGYPSSRSVPPTRGNGQSMYGSSGYKIITEEDTMFGRPSRQNPYDPAPLPAPSPMDARTVPGPVSFPSASPSPVSRSAFDVRRSTFGVRSVSPVTGLLFYHLDALGSTVNLTAADGAVAESYLYDAWGNYRELDVAAGSPGLLASTPGPMAPGQLAFAKGSGASGPGLRAAGETLIIDPDLDENGLYCWATYLAYLQGAFSPDSHLPSPDSNRLTYTGHEFDPATGLYYFKARFYDPEVGRFLSEDPYLGDAATPPSLHRFLYAYSNPLRYVDLTGYQNLSAEEILQRKLQANKTLERLADLKSSSAAGDAARRLPAAAGRAIFSSEVYKTAVEELLAELETGARNPGNFIDGLVTGTIMAPEQVGDWIKEQLPVYRDTLIRWDKLSDEERNGFVQGLTNRGWINVTKAGIIVVVTHQARIVVESSGRVVREQILPEHRSNQIQPFPNQQTSHDLTQLKLSGKSIVESDSAPKSGMTSLGRDVRQYIREIEANTGMSLPETQRLRLAEALRSRRFAKISTDEARRHRAAFNKMKNDLIIKWEQETGQEWPRYKQDVINKNGVVLRRAGQKYDAHHIIESQYAGPNEWWNIHPAEFPSGHQGGVHGSDSVSRRIFE